MEPSLFSYTRSSRARDESRGAGAARVAVGAVHVLEEAPAMASTRFGVGGEGEGDGGGGGDNRRQVPVLREVE